MAKAPPAKFTVMIPAKTELLGLRFTLRPKTDLVLPAQYTTQFHGWFLHQIRQIDPLISEKLHDGQDEKAFTISQLRGPLLQQGRELRLSARETYQWQITALSGELCAGLSRWLKQLPRVMELSAGRCEIIDVQGHYPATTYAKIWQQCRDGIPLELTFLTATSFRKRGNHMPLPIPENIFHSYLRRWNSFAGRQFDQDAFLSWVNDSVVMLRHGVRSQKAQAGKSGSVTGFTGSIQLGLTAKAGQQPEYVQLVRALVRCAPYFNTGHKVTFGLGDTELGWNVGGWSWDDEPGRLLSVAVTKESFAERSQREIASAKEVLIAARERELEPIFLGLKVRQGGERGVRSARLWARIMARLEMGVTLKAIAEELEMPYDTVKKYAQIAKKCLDS
jgi:CRISPR-associated endoribonuclease Cas6